MCRRGKFTALSKLETQSPDQSLRNPLFIRTYLRVRKREINIRISRATPHRTTQWYTTSSKKSTTSSSNFRLIKTKLRLRVLQAKEWNRQFPRIRRLLLALVFSKIGRSTVNQMAFPSLKRCQSRTNPRLITMKSAAAKTTALQSTSRARSNWGKKSSTWWASTTSISTERLFLSSQLRTASSTTVTEAG